MNVSLHRRSKRPPSKSGKRSLPTHHLPAQKKAMLHAVAMLVSIQAVSCFHLQPRLPVSRQTSRLSPLFVSSSSQNNNGSDSSVDEERRMAMVRYIQQSFYTQNGDNNYIFEAPTLANGGLLRNLPLWRVPWVELPGRTNVLNVHEAVYTNMFETLLRSGTKDLYFGHVFLDQGTKNLKSHPIQPWFANDEPNPVSSSIGTLMRVTDYRRLSNGRLLMLVQAMERFVVTQTVADLPYARADVQLVPDLDQWVTTSDDCRLDNWQTTNAGCGNARAQALVDSFAWHPYEYEDTRFRSLPSHPEPGDIVGSVLAQVLPYAGLDPARLPTDVFWPPDVSTDASKDAFSVVEPVAASEPSLEAQLLNTGVLQTFQPPESTRNCSLAEIELRVWWAVNDYLLVTKTPVSPVLLGFLPPGVTWPHDFVLHTIANELPQQTVFQHKYIPVAAAYPAILRQRKLSFHVAALVLRNDDAGILLQLPSTALRLHYVLWKLEEATASFQ